MQLTTNKFYIFLLLALIVGIGAYFWYQPEPSNSPSVDELTFLSTETNLSYNDFLDNLEQHCPYYEPNGVQYRECLFNLLTQREQEADRYQADLIRNIQAITDPEFLTARQTFVSHLRELGSMWKPYRDQLCLTPFDSMWGGSNQGGANNTCRLYETARYLQLLQKLEAEWL